MLLEALGEYKKAIETLNNLKNYLPGDAHVVEELATIYISKLNNPGHAIEALMSTFNHYVQKNGTVFFILLSCKILNCVG